MQSNESIVSFQTMIPKPMGTVVAGWSEDTMAYTNVEQSRQT